MSIKKNITIARKILIGNVLLSIFTLLIGSLFINNFTQSLLIKQATAQSTKEIQLLQINLSNLIIDIENYVAVLSIDKSLQNLAFQYNDFSDTNAGLAKKLILRNDINSSLAQYKFENRHIYDIAFLDRKKIPQAMANYSNYALFLENSTLEILNSITSEKKASWSGLIMIEDNTPDENSLLFLSKPIFSTLSSVLLGYIVVTINEKAIASVYSNELMTSKDTIIILDNDNRVVSSNNKTLLTQKFSDIPFYDSIDISTVNHKVYHLDKKDYYVSSTSSLSNGWKIVTISPMSILSSTSNQIGKFIVITILLCSAAALFISFFIARLISTPLVKFSKQIKSYDPSKPVVLMDYSKNDEIGYLGRQFNHLMERVNTLMESLVKEQTASRNYEFKLLQSQIKPHFLYNSIETIISLIRLGFNDEAILVASSLASFYRLSLSKGKEIIKISEELQLIDKYLSIQKIRYHECLNYTIDVDPSLYDHMIPKLTLQPLVENAIYHGLKPLDRLGDILITGKLEENGLSLSIYDSGVGIAPAQIDKLLSKDEEGEDVSFGLASTHSRLKLLFGEGYGLTISSEVGKFTLVTIKLPLNE